jgi:SPP1 family predicted phage head-tail adaptor
MPGAGSLKERITIQRATVAPDDYNAPIRTWAALATVWAERMDASAGESYRAREVGAEITRRFRIRHSSDVADVNPDDRLLFGGVEHNITAVREIERNRWLEIDCVARADIAAQTEGSP